MNIEFQSDSKMSAASQALAWQLLARQRAVCVRLPGRRGAAHDQHRFASVPGLRGVGQHPGAGARRPDRQRLGSALAPAHRSVHQLHRQGFSTGPQRGPDHAGRRGAAGRCAAADNRPREGRDGDEMRLALALSMAGLLGACRSGAGRARHGGLAQSRTPAGTVHTGKAFRFNKVADGVYHAIGTGRAPGRRQLRRDRQRRGSDDRGRPRVARGRLGAAGRGEGADAQAGALRGQHALPLRPRARQPGVRAERGDHRPRVHAADAHRRQVLGDADLQELPGRAPRHHRGPSQARRLRDGSRGQGQAAGPAPGGGTEPGLAEGAASRAAQRDAADRADAAPRQPRDPAPLPRPRPHGRRRRGVPAARAHRHHRGLPDVGPVEHERLLSATSG